MLRGVLGQSNERLGAGLLGSTVFHAHVHEVVVVMHRLVRFVDPVILVSLHTLAVLLIYRLDLLPVWVRGMFIALAVLGTTINLADPRSLLSLVRRSGADERPPRNPT